MDHLQDEALSPPSETRCAIEACTVIHVISGLDRGGAEAQLLALARRQAARARTIVVSVMSGGDLVPEFRKSGIEVHHLLSRRNFPNPLTILRLARLICRAQPDVVQGWMYHGNLAATLALSLSRRRADTTLIWGLRCSKMDLQHYGWKLRLAVHAGAKLSRLPDAIVANAEAGRSVHRSMGYRNARFEVIHNGIDSERFFPEPSKRAPRRAELGLPPDARVLANVARVDPMKSHALLIDALARTPDLWCLLAGRGTEAFAGGEQLIAMGQTTDVPGVLAAADGIVSTSSYGEGFSNAIAEGMASGLVPVVTDVGDSRVIVGDIGWIVPPRDPEALAAALRAFRDASDSELAARGAAARARIVERFPLDALDARFAALYQALRGPIPE